MKVAFQTATVHKLLFLGVFNISVLAFLRSTATFNSILVLDLPKSGAIVKAQLLAR